VSGLRGSRHPLGYSLKLLKDLESGLIWTVTLGGGRRSYVAVPNFWGESGEAREVLVPDIADDGFGDGLSPAVWSSSRGTMAYRWQKCPRIEAVICVMFQTFHKKY
jgi:hypothetical protein